MGRLPVTTPPAGTPATPLYGLYYLAPGQPARDTRLVLQANAEKTEAALAAGGVAAPGASDLLAVAARVTALEADTPWQTVTRHSSWAAGTIRYQLRHGFLALRLELERGVGLGWPANTLIGTLPAGARPDVTATFPCFYGTTIHAVEVRPAGDILAVTAASGQSGLYGSLSGWPL